MMMGVSSTRFEATKYPQTPLNTEGNHKERFRKSLAIKKKIKGWIKGWVGAWVTRRVEDKLG